MFCSRIKGMINEPPQVPLPAAFCERNSQSSPEGKWRTVDLTNKSGGFRV